MMTDIRPCRLAIISAVVGALLIGACATTPSAVAPVRAPVVSPSLPAPPPATLPTIPPPPLTEYFGAERASRAAAAAASTTTLRYDARRGVDLAFFDADVRRVIDSVLGSTLRLTYTVDPKVTGTLTLRTARPVARESLLPLLESALSTVGAAIVRRGAIYDVVPIEAARDRAALAGTPTGARSLTGYAVEVIPLRYAGAREVARLLERITRKENILSVDPAYNQIVLAGTGPEREAVRRMIERLDVDWLSGMSFALYRLENVDPVTLEADLEKLFQPPIDVLGSRVRLVPLPRLRAVIGIAADRSDLVRLEPWIRRLDTGGTGTKRKLYSYAVQNGRAKDIAASLSQLIGGAATGQQADEGPSRSSFPATQTRRIDSGNGSGGELADRSVDRPSAPLSATSPPGGSLSGATSSAEPRIVPNEENNSLLIYANGEEYEFIREVLGKIDRPVAQVMIEAVLAEVTLSDSLRFGLQWLFNSDNSSFTLSDAGAAVPLSVFPGFSYVYAGTDARVVLNALQARTNVRVLSAPKLMVLNNQTATLQVGDQVPIVTQQGQSTVGAGSPIVNTVELRDTGVILQVTPRVNESGTIILDISQEVSDVVPTTTSGIDSPTIQQRRISSTVATQSGRMIALGGLIRESTTRGKRGIPLLSQIPVLGAAFGTTTRDRRRTELIILLTPIVMRTPGETQAVTDDLIDGLDQVKPLVRDHLARQPRVPGSR